MDATLHVVPGSHPCATVERALQLKGIAYERHAMVPLLHKLQQRARFGGTTVPGLEIRGERILGSRNILRRLDELVPDPPLLPADPAARSEVELAERWGDEVLQHIARRVSWAALRRAPAASPSYVGGDKLPLPGWMQKLGAWPIAEMEARVNHADDASVRADLASLDAHLTRIDDWVDAGVLGGEPANAADLQIGASLRLLLSFDDVRPAVEAHPKAAALGWKTFSDYPGHVPAGALPAAWLPASV